VALFLITKELILSGVSRFRAKEPPKIIEKAQKIGHQSRQERKDLIRKAA
jgi:hypothetical protein